MIVSVDELKAHLRIEYNDEDCLLVSLLAMAQAAASDYCHTDFDDMVKAPEAIRLAVMLMASHFYENRENADRSAYNSMMAAFHALLYPHRQVEGMF